LANVGTYSITETATVDGIQRTKTITITVKDPCSRAIMQPSTPSPIPAMVLTLNFDSTVTQTLAVKTDIEINYAIVCSLTCSLVSPPVYLTKVASNLTANALAATTADVGPHNINVNCVSTNFPATVTAKTYTFVLTVKYCQVNSLTLSPIAHVDYLLGQPPIDATFLAASISNLAC
jgi:hypothetical protein